ncbi:MAG: hypothetical protein JXC33_07955 [Deltaproteobacteria bacterium]|nr:hypothetical protein [Deltaproteobacteria bacterium]
MVGFLSRIVTWFGAAGFSLFGAWKIFFAGTFIAFLMVGAYNLVAEIIQELLNFVITQVGTVEEPEGFTIAAFTGFVGWFLSVMKIPECMSFIVTMITLKWTLRKIPLLRW